MNCDVNAISKLYREQLDDVHVVQGSKPVLVQVYHNRKLKQVLREQRHSRNLQRQDSKPLELQRLVES